MNTVGERIKYIRDKHGHNQGLAARTIGVSQGSLSDIENNNTKPSIDTVISVSRNYKVSTDWILTGEVYSAGEELPPGLEIKIHTNESSNNEYQNAVDLNNEYRKRLKQVELDNEEEVIMEMYRLLPIEDKEDIKILLLHKFGRTEYSRKKKGGLSTSGHGEEAATREAINKKMA